MPTECSADRFGFGVVSGRDVVTSFAGGAMTSDARTLLPGAVDRPACADGPWPGAACKIGGNRLPVLLGATDTLTNRLATRLDWTVRALAADLRADGIQVSHDAVWRFMRRRGLIFQKNAAGE